MTTIVEGMAAAAALTAEHPIGVATPSASRRRAAARP